MSRTNHVTMKDVATMAGVSVQTVSAVINGKPGITRETSERILNIIDKLGYRPFSVARSLRTHETRTIAMVVSDIANPSFATMASAAEDYLHSLGYSLALYNTHDDNEREARYIQMASERWVDGMLLVSTHDQSESLKLLEKAQIPHVVIDRGPEKHPAPSVTLDNRMAGRMAADHLLELGHRRFAHISGPMMLRLARERLSGFVDRLKECGEENISTIESKGWKCEDGYAAMKTLLERGDRPTGVFAANDRSAMGAILAASEKGLSVPGDISVIGLDDIEVSAYTIPPLTTLRQSFSTMGMKGAELLLALISGQAIARRDLVIEPELIIRKSTAKPGCL